MFIDGVAASAASLIAMAGDRIVAAPNAMLMIHNPWGLLVGTAAKMRETADQLDRVCDVTASTYAARTGQDVEDIRAWMMAERWMTAHEALARGFVDEITAAARPPRPTKPHTSSLL